MYICKITQMPYKNRVDQSCKGVRLQSANAVEGIPNLSLPDVCTNAAVHRMAFCQEHCDLLTSTNPNIPTDLRGFLRYCTSRGEALLHNTCILVK
jgi:hypothetical protein